MPAGSSQTPDWESHRGVIKRLYLVQDMTQNEVRETLKREYDVTISESQLKKQLDKWGLAAKNVKLSPSEKAALLQLQEGRQKQENKGTEFRRWKKFVDPRTFARFKNSLKNQNTPILSLIDSSVRLSGVSYRTPSINGTVSSRSLSVNGSHYEVSGRGSSRASSVAGSSRAPSRSNRTTTLGSRNRVPPRAQTDRRWRRANIVEIITKYMHGPTDPAASLEGPNLDSGSPTSPAEIDFNDFINQDMLQHDPEPTGPSRLSSVVGQTPQDEQLLPTDLGPDTLQVGDDELLPADPDALLVLAVTAGDNEAVLESLGNGANPNTLVNSESTVLGLAVMFGWGQVVDTLLDRGADLTTCQKDGLLPLHWAIVKDRQALVELLILRGADPNGGRSQIGGTPLHLAVRVGREEIVDVLLKYGADVHAPDCLQWTPLHLAVRWGVCTQTLLDHGADVNAKNGDSNTPLHFAANWGTASMIQALLSCGADVDAENCFHLTPLQTAVSSARDAAIVASLLGYGANGNLKFQDGSTVLHKAVFLRENDTVQLLLSSGVESAVRCQSGKTPLGIAVGYGNLDAVRLLIEHNKGAAAKTAIHEGLLREALKYQRFTIARLLLQNATSPNETDKTALHWAVSEGSIPAADFLLRNGADIDARDWRERTPIQIALARGDEPMVGWLRLKGAIEISDRADIGVVVGFYC